MDKYKNKINIRKIAELSKVSPATVSRVLNFPEKVSEKKRLAVEKIIKQYGYVPNQLAKNMFSNTSTSIALMIQDFDNPFFNKLIKEINNIAFKHHFTVIVCEIQNDEEKESEYIQYLKGMRIAGIIFTTGSSEKNIHSVEGIIPYVTLDRFIDGSSYPSITSDNYQGARDAMEYLIRLNHKKIGFVSSSNSLVAMKMRKKGYLDVLKEHNIFINEDYLYEENNADLHCGIKALEYFLTINDMPTAIFCGNDLIAQGLIQRAYTLNMSVPEDISVIGFDGVLNELLYRPLTTVKQQIREMAHCTMDILLNMINKKDYERKRIIDTKLIIGETCKMNKEE